MHSNQKTLSVAALVRSAKPVLRISALSAIRWRKPPMAKANDCRIGPWHAPIYEVLDEAAYRRSGECLYFLLDGGGCLRYVGESKNRLRDRWRTPPALCAETGVSLGNPFLFHNRAWRHLEHALKSDPACGPFEVRVLLKSELTEQLRQVSEGQRLIDSTTRAAGKHLSKVVETWICAQHAVCEGIWNVAGVRRHAIPAAN